MYITAFCDDNYSNEDRWQAFQRCSGPQQWPSAPTILSDLFL